MCRSWISKETDGSECSGSQTEPGGNHVQPARDSAQPEVSENQHMFMAWKITAKLIHEDVNCCFSMNRKSGRKQHNVLWKQSSRTFVSQKSMNITRLYIIHKRLLFPQPFSLPRLLGELPLQSFKHLAATFTNTQWNTFHQWITTNTHRNQLDSRLCTVRYRAMHNWTFIFSE